MSSPRALSQLLRALLVCNARCYAGQCNIAELKRSLARVQCSLTPDVQLRGRESARRVIYEDAQARCFREECKNYVMHVGVPAARFYATRRRWGILSERVSYTFVARGLDKVVLRNDKRNVLICNFRGV